MSEDIWSVLDYPRDDINGPHGFLVGDPDGALLGADSGDAPDESAAYDLLRDLVDDEVAQSERTEQNGNGTHKELTGSNRNDKLSGSPGADFLRGRGGNDYINGGKGPDILLGNNGNDTILGGLGADLLDGAMAMIVCLTARARMFSWWPRQRQVAGKPWRRFSRRRPGQ